MTKEEKVAIAELRVEVANIKEDIYNIKNNDIKCLFKKLDRLQWFIFATVVGIAVQLALFILFRT